MSSQGQRTENDKKAAGPKPDRCLHSRGREEKKGKKTVKEMEEKKECAMPR